MGNPLRAQKVHLMQTIIHKMDSPVMLFPVFLPRIWVIIKSWSYHKIAHHAFKIKTCKCFVNICMINAPTRKALLVSLIDLILQDNECCASIFTTKSTVQCCFIFEWCSILGLISLIQAYIKWNKQRDWQWPSYVGCIWPQQPGPDWDNNWGWESIMSAPSSLYTFTTDHVYCNSFVENLLFFYSSITHISGSSE